MTEIFMLADKAGGFKMHIIADNATPVDLGTDSNPIKPPKKLAIDSLDTAIFMLNGISKIHFYKTLVDYQNNSVLFTLTNGNYEQFRTVRTYMMNANIAEAHEPLQDLYMSFTLDNLLDPASPGHIAEYKVWESISDMNAATREGAVDNIENALALVGNNSGNQANLITFLTNAKNDLEGIDGGVTTNIVTEDHGFNV